MMVGVPVTTRNISKLSDGIIAPCASSIIGTRRTIPSRSVLIVSRPRPAAASSSGFTLRNRPGKLEHEGLRVFAQHGEPGTGSVLSSSRMNLGKSGFAQHHARVPHRVRQNLIVARQRAQLDSGLLVEISDGVGRGVGIEPVGLRET